MSKIIDPRQPGKQFSSLAAPGKNITWIMGHPVQKSLSVIHVLRTLPPMKAQKHHGPYCYENREEAGQMLADLLTDFRDRQDTVVLAVPRSGVPVAAALAEKLHLRLALFPCRKLVHPGNPGVTIGSVCHDEIILHPDQDIPTNVIRHQVDRMKRELIPQQEHFGTPAEILRDKVVIVVDDRLKQEDTLAAGLQSLQKKKPRKIVVAVVVATYDQVSRLESEGVEVVALQTYPSLSKTSRYFRDFHSPSESEILQIWRKFHEKDLS